MIYNVSELTQGTNIAEWMVIINSWSNGVIFTTIFVFICLLIFGIMRMQNVSFDNAAIATSFLGAIITSFAWLIRHEGITLVPTVVPVIMFCLLGGSIFLKIINGWLND